MMVEPKGTTISYSTVQAEFSFTSFKLSDRIEYGVAYACSIISLT